MTEQKSPSSNLTIPIRPFNENEFVEYVKKQAEGKYGVVIGVDSNSSAGRIANKLSALNSMAAEYDPSINSEYVFYTPPWNLLCHAHEGVQTTINIRTKAEGEIHRARIHMEEHPDPTCLYFQQNEMLALMRKTHNFHILVTSIPRLAHTTLTIANSLYLFVSSTYKKNSIYRMKKIKAEDITLSDIEIGGYRKVKEPSPVEILNIGWVKQINENEFLLPSLLDSILFKANTEKFNKKLEVASLKYSLFPEDLEEIPGVNYEVEPLSLPKQKLGYLPLDHSLSIKRMTGITGRNPDGNICNQLLEFKYLSEQLKKVHTAGTMALTVNWEYLKFIEKLKSRSKKMVLEYDISNCDFETFLEAFNIGRHKKLNAELGKDKVIKRIIHDFRFNHLLSPNSHWAGVEATDLTSMFYRGLKENRYDSLLVYGSQPLYHEITDNSNTNGTTKLGAVKYRNEQEQREALTRWLKVLSFFFSKSPNSNHFIQEPQFDLALKLYPELVNEYFDVKLSKLKTD